MAAFVRFGLATRQNTGFARANRAAHPVNQTPAARTPPAFANSHDDGPLKPNGAPAAGGVRRSQDSSSFNRAPQEHL